MGPRPTLNQPPQRAWARPSAGTKPPSPATLRGGPSQSQLSQQGRRGVGEATPRSASVSSVIMRTQADRAMSPAGPATHPGVTLSLVPVNARPAVQSLCEPRGRRCLQVEGQRSSRQMRQTPTGPMSSPHLSQCVPRWGQTPMPGPEETRSSTP